MSQAKRSWGQGVQKNVLDRENSIFGGGRYKTAAPWCECDSGRARDSSVAIGSLQPRTGPQCCLSAFSDAPGISSSLAWDRHIFSPHLTFLGHLSRSDALTEVLETMILNILSQPSGLYFKGSTPPPPLQLQKHHTYFLIDHLFPECFPGKPTWTHYPNERFFWISR